MSATAQLKVVRDSLFSLETSLPILQAERTSLLKALFCKLGEQIIDAPVYYVCPGCGIEFLKPTKKFIYCTDACRNRCKVREFRERQKAALTAAE